MTSVLIFMSASGKGIQITYPTISLHAISRADLGPSIYCQLDEMVELDHEPTQDEEDAMEMRELRINVPETSCESRHSVLECPTDDVTVEPMFEALSQCAALHPDENEDEDEDDFDEAFLDTDEGNVNQSNGTEQEELSEAGRVRSDLSQQPHNARFAPY
jgi:nucleotide-sensitive chloride channel 1A